MAVNLPAITTATVTAKTVDRNTLQELSGDLVANSTKFVFVRISCLLAPSSPLVTEAVLRFAQVGASSASAQVYVCSEEKIISSDSCGLLQQSPYGAGFRRCVDLTDRLCPEFGGDFFFAIVCNEGEIRLSGGAVSLQTLGLDYESAASYAAQGPRCANVAFGFGACEVDTLVGSASLSIPLFETNTCLGSIKLALNYLSPKHKPSSGGPTGLLQNGWRLSVERSLWQSGGDYLYKDGSGLIHRFALAANQSGDEATKVYVDTAKTFLVLVVAGGTKKIFAPDGESVEFNEQGRISCRRRQKGSHLYALQYAYDAAGRLTSVHDGSLLRVFFSHAANSLTCYDGKGRACSISLGADGVVGALDARGKAISFSYESIGFGSNAFRALTSVGREGESVEFSRAGDRRIAAVRTKSGGATKDIYAFSYSLYRCAMTESHYGPGLSQEKTEWAFDGDGNGVALLRGTAQGWDEETGYSFDDDCAGALGVSPTEPEQSASGGYVRKNAPLTIPLSRQEPPSVFLYLVVSGQTEAGHFHAGPELVIDFVDHHGATLDSRSLRRASGRPTPWFVPIKPAISPSVENIRLSTGATGYAFYVSKAEVRMLSDGYTLSGRPDIGQEEWTADPGAIAPFSGMEAKLVASNVESETPFSSKAIAITNSLLHSTHLPLSVLFTGEGEACLAAESILARKLPSGDFEPLESIPVASGTATYCRIFLGAGPSERIVSASRGETFSRTSSGFSRSTRNCTYYRVGTDTHKVAKAQSQQFDDHMALVSRSGDNGFAEGYAYDEYGNPTLAWRTVNVLVGYEGSSPVYESRTSTLFRRAYSSQGQLLSSEASLEGGPTSSQIYTYNSLGVLASILPPGISSGNELNLLYQDGEISGVSYINEGSPITSSLSKDSDDESVSLFRLVSGANTLLAMDETITHGPSCRSLDSLSSAAGWSLTRKESINALGRAEFGKGASATNPDTKETRDRFGKILSRENAGATTEEYSYYPSGANKGMASGVADGRSHGQRHFAYDGDGRPVWVYDSSDNDDITYGFERVGSTYFSWERHEISTIQGTIYRTETKYSGASDDLPLGQTATETQFPQIPGRPAIHASTEAIGPQSYRGTTLYVGSSVNYVTRASFMADPADPAKETANPLSYSFGVSDGHSSATLTETYSYDQAGRLAGSYDASTGVAHSYARDQARGFLSQESWSRGGTSRAIYYNYDGSGNVTTIVANGGVTTLSYQKERLVEAARGGTHYGFSYDQAGRPTTYMGAAASWDGARLSSISGRGTLSYSGSALSAETSSSGAHYQLRYVLGRLVGETASIGEQTYSMDYVYGGSGEVVGFFLGNAFYAFRRNALGDVTALYSGASCAAVYAYDAFGRAFVFDPQNGFQQSDDPSFVGNLNPFRYRGARYLRALGLYCMGARLYDPELCRFLTPDEPEYLDPCARFGLNPYAYCLNDPVTYADPTGHSPFLIALVFGVAVGAGIGMAFNAVKQYVSNGGWKNFDWLSFIGSGLLGGALGAAEVLGGAAGLTYAGATIPGYTLSVGASLLISTATVSAGNMLDYSFKMHGNITAEGLWEAGWKGALKGVATFGVSFVAGTNGLFLDKTYSPTFAQDFYFLNPCKAWVQRTLSYRLVGEFGARPLFASAPAALIRWLIDQW